MPMETVIREKRKALGLTQEQVAQRLGVSTPAVSKWETGASYPDLPLLPPLARLLGVDLNTLLCFHDGLTKEEVAQFCLEVSRTVREEGFPRGAELVREKVRAYPTCGPLFHHAALTLDGALMMSATGPDRQAEYTPLIIDLYEKALEHGDERTQNHAAFMLASKAMAQGDDSRAQALLDRLPEPDLVDKRQLQATLLTRQSNFLEAAKVQERRLLSSLNQLQATLWSLVVLALKEGDDTSAARIAEVSRQSAQLFELWDYNALLGPLELALAREDVEESLALLDRMLSALSRPWSTEDTVLYRHLPSGAWSAETMLPALLGALETDPQYAFLRREPAFQALVRRYRETC